MAEDMELKKSPPGQRAWNIILVAILVLSASYFRLADLGGHGLNTDETTWMKRGAYLVRMLGRGDPVEATSHLRHPGIIPAFFSGTARVLYEKAAGAIPAFKAIDPVMVYRFPFAVIGVLLCLFMFLWGRRLMPAPAAWLGAMLLALDSHSIGLSRVVHLDSAMTFFLLLSVLAFLIGEEEGRWVWKAASSILLGCALLTKITSLILIPCLLAIRAMVFLRGRKPRELSRWLKELSGDLLWAAGGLFVYLSFFPALWQAPGSWKWWEDTPEILSLLGGISHRLPLILILLPLAALVVTQIVLVRRETRGLSLSDTARKFKRYNPIIILSLSVILILLIYRNPLLSFTAQLTRVSEVGSRSFHAYRYWGGEMVPALPWYFYPLVTFFALSEVFLFLLLLGSGFVLAGLGRRQRNSLLYHTLLLFPLFFTLVMSLSQVRALRYIQPVIPFLAFLAGIGAFELHRWWKGILHDRPPRAIRSHGPEFWKTIPVVLLTVLLLYSAFGAWKMGPYYRLYYNRFIGGPEGMSKVRSTLWGEGHKKTVEYLKGVIQSGDRIYAYGYTDVLRYYWRRIHPDRGKDILINRKWYFPEVEYLVVFKNHLPAIERTAARDRRARRTLAFIRRTPPLHTVITKGVEAARIYRTPTPDVLDSR